MKVGCRWSGAFLVPSEQDIETIRKKFGLKVGDALTVEIKSPRSPRQHGFLFHCINKAFENWPEDHPFQPYDSEQLRYWLEVRAGWGSIMKRATPTTVIALAQMAWNRPLIIEEHETSMCGDPLYTVYTPSSIAYNRMGKEDFEKLVDNIDKVLQAEIGVSMDSLREAVLCDAS